MARYLFICLLTLLLSYTVVIPFSKSRVEGYCIFCKLKTLWKMLGTRIFNLIYSATRQEKQRRKSAWCKTSMLLTIFLTHENWSKERKRKKKANDSSGRPVKRRRDCIEKGMRDRRRRERLIRNNDFLLFWGETEEVSYLTDEEGNHFAKLT